MSFGYRPGLDLHYEEFSCGEGYSVKKMMCIWGLASLGMGCFSAPNEPDWIALEGTEIANSEAQIEDSPDSSSATATAIIPADTDQETFVEDDTFDGFEENELDSTSVDAENEDAEVEDECTSDSESGSCDTAGAKRCNSVNEAQVETCIDLGDGCLYWTPEFCESGLCKDGACQ